MNLEVKENQELDGEYLCQTQEDRNKGILKGWLPFWVKNAFENYGYIAKESKGQCFCISTIRKKDRGPAVIVGSGPSLDDTAPLLGDWKGAIFTSGSNALVPWRWGHKPEYICIFDGGDTMYGKFMGYDWSGTMLICNPSISPYILKNWRWDKRYYLMRHHGVEWFDEIMPLAFGNFIRFPVEAPPCIQMGVGNAGCTVNNEIQLANYLGYGPLFLIGVDFGYPEGKERSTRWVKEQGEWVDVGIETTHDRKLHRSDNGMLTTEEQIEYKSALMAVYKWDKPQLFDCSNGIITELPKLNFKEVVEKNGRGFEKYYKSNEDIVRIAEEYERSRQRLQAARIDNSKIENPVDKIKRVITENSGECKG